MRGTVAEKGQPLTVTQPQALIARLQTVVYIRLHLKSPKSPGGQSRLRYIVLGIAKEKKRGGGGAVARALHNKH